MVNVVPLNDEKNHDLSAQCWCDPEVEWQCLDTKEIYVNGPIIIHNAADCRETVEYLLGEGSDSLKNWAIFTTKL